MKNKKTHSAGFSLIEVLLAMVFLTVIILGVLKLQTSAKVLTSSQKNDLKAHFYVTQALEIAQAVGKDGFKGCETECALVENAGNYLIQSSEKENLEAGKFQRYFEVTESLNQAILVTASVVWVDNSGEHQVTAKRIIF